MSKKNAHTDRVPEVGQAYANDYLVGEIVEVSPRLTAQNGKEYFRFGIVVLMITAPDNENAQALVIGEVIYRQATPHRKADGTWNLLRNASAKGVK
jgi:hypothetical protein